MLAVSVSLFTSHFTSQLMGQMPWDEEQLIRKKPPEAPQAA